MTDFQTVVRAREGGTALALRVVPRSRRPGLDGLHGAAARLRVTAPPAAGKANAEVLALVASLLALRRRDVELVGGERSRDKTVHVHGLGPAEVAARLARHASPGGAGGRVG